MMRSEDTAELFDKAEYRALEPYGEAFWGDVGAQVLCVVSGLGGKRPCSQGCLDALEKSATALGFDPKAIAFACIGSLPQSLSLVGLVEAVDPVLVVSLEREATHELCVAYDVAESIDAIRGRTFIALDDFEGALNDEEKKRRAWHELKRGTRKRNL